jgi:hypothetical protein
LLISNPGSLENIEQFETFLKPREVDGLPCMPSNWVENPKDRRLRIPKVLQINFNCNWTKNPDKILTPADLQIFFNVHNTLKLINEAY